MCVQMANLRKVAKSCTAQIKKTISNNNNIAAEFVPKGA